MIFEKQIVNMYRGMAYTRCDDNGTAYYFSADDFAGLHKESYRFKSSKGYNLSILMCLIIINVPLFLYKKLTAVCHTAVII